MSFFVTFLLFLVGGTIFVLAKSWNGLTQIWATSRDTFGGESAERVLKDRKRALSSNELPQPADIREFAFRGFKFYNSSQAALEALGCTMLGDFALDHAEWVRPGFRTFLRVLRSRDREIVCSIIDATPHLAGMSVFEKLHFYFVGTHKKNRKAVSLRTELSDGRFVITATDMDLVREELPAHVLKETLPSKTTAAELMNRHRVRIARAIDDAPAIVVRIGTVEEHGQSWVRHQRILRAWRETIGYALTETEHRDFTDVRSPLQKDLADSMLESMRALESDPKRQAS